jgi:ABC-type uncharacterized transport system permease subunit
MASATATSVSTTCSGSCFGAGCALSVETTSSFTGETDGGAGDATLISLAMIISSY